MQNIKLENVLPKFLPLCIALVLSACNSGGSSSPSGSSSGAWGWISGSNESGAFGVYGTKGIAAGVNIPGARAISVSWTDSKGSLWLFGGDGNSASASGDLNDLWQFNPTTNQWTWVSGESSINNYGVYGVKGVAANGNEPGSRYGGVSWVDSNNNLWLFGGYGYARDGAPGTLNDLWQYNIGNNQWTWVSGESSTGFSGIYGIKGIADILNEPGARLGDVSFVDSNGDLLLFGGAADLELDNKYNDLWKYDITNNRWTWMSGESTFNESGLYGIQGHPAYYTVPGARLDSVGWADDEGDLFIFGGTGYAAGSTGDLNDLWKYSESSGQWTWLSGSNQSNANGVYGTQGVSSANSIPGAREHRVPVSWTDCCGNLWMFGGYGYGASGLAGDMNDLWYFSAGTNQWTWVSGSTQPGASGVYGTQGVLSSSNIPGARKDSIGWFDATGYLWIFGGSNTGANNIARNLNDLWKFRQ